MKNKKVEIPETRGAKPKYDFSGFEIGETRIFEDNYTQKLITAAKNWAKRHGFEWKFRCYTVENKVFIVRIA